MKEALIPVALLIISAGASAQTATRARRSSDQSTGTESSAVRERIVDTRANHVAWEKRRPDANSSDSGQQKQSAPQPAWGNTAVTVPPARIENRAVAQTQFIPVDKNTPTGQLARPSLTIVEPNSIVRNARTTSAAPGLPRSGPVAATDTYKIGVGDVLDISISDVATRDSTLFTVLKNGTVDYPLVASPVSVVGLTADEIASLVSDQIKVIHSASVNVRVRDYASHAVVVTGAVDNPGRKILRREAMPLYAVLSDALVRPEAITATITRRGKELSALAMNNQQAMSALVQAGDVIRIGTVAETGKFLYVGGEVASPGEKSFREGMTLTQAILAAGGPRSSGKLTIKVARQNAKGFLSTSEYQLRSIEQGKSPDPPVQAGDRIEIISVTR